MIRISPRRLAAIACAAALVPLSIATSAVASATVQRNHIVIQRITQKLAACGSFDASVLDPRPIPADLDPSNVLGPISQMAYHDQATVLGASQPLDPVWYNAVKVTPAEQKEICEKHLTAVFLDWSGVPYNLAIESGARMVFDALGIKLLRITDYSLNSNGLAGDVAAVLPLHPNILVTGGTVSSAQFGAILKPALDQGVAVISWSLGSPTLKVGQNEPIKSIVSYDFYNLGLQLAAAIHAEYPRGANFGYIHWVNDNPGIFNRETGLLVGLKKYPNIHIITNGTPSPTTPASGFTDANSSEAFTEAFLTGHPTVNVLFAPWEDPPGLGEVAAVKALHLSGKVHIATMDMSDAGAQELSHGGIISVDMAEDVYDGGRTLALLGGLTEIGQNHTPYAIVPTFPVTSHTNVASAWSFMHGPQVTCPTGDC